MEHTVIFQGDSEAAKQLVYAQIREAKRGDRVRVSFPNGLSAQPVLESLIWCAALYGAVLDVVNEVELVFEVRRTDESTLRTMKVGSELTQSTFAQVSDLILQCEPGESLCLEFDQGLPEQKELDFLVMNAFYSRGRIVRPTIEGNRLLLTVE